MSYTLPFKAGQNICELGGGATPSFHPNVDVRKLPEVDIVQNLEEDFSNIGRWDNIYCAYIAEHISWRKVKTFFKSCYNILNPQGVAVFIVPNTLEQIIHLAQKPDITLEDSCVLFGDQDYSDNTHKWIMEPKLVGALLKEAGFDRIKISDHPDQKSFDMIIEAYKDKERNVKPLSEMYEREYFEDETDGYLGYWDFPTHHQVVNTVLTMNPQSVLDIGGARGYISKHLRAEGIPSTCMDVSNHCYHTRALDEWVKQDAFKTPWGFKDKEFDLAISTSFMEHIPENLVDNVIKEIARVSQRSYHEITFEITDRDIDSTHRRGTMKNHDWWMNKFKEVAPEHKVHIRSVDEAKSQQQTISLPHPDNYVKWQFGSHIGMFYYGWINSDILDLSKYAKDTGRSFAQVDCRKPLQIQDNSVDYIVSHHMIEHLTREEGQAFMKECYRILKPGGTIRLSAPDMKLLSQHYVDGTMGYWKDVSVEVEKATDNALAFFNTLVSGHQTGYDDESLLKLFTDAGFDAYVSEFDKSKSEVIRLQTIDSLPTLSVYVEGKKPKLPYGNISSTATVKPDDALLRYLHG